jgi:hypothetical protein
MKLKTELIREGRRVGEIVWVCDYRQPDLSIKPIRHVPPTKVAIVSNDDLPKNKTVYYSKTHFVPVNKKGALLKKVISPVDNTGFRSRSGEEINVFENECECINFYRKQCDDIIKRLEAKKLVAVQHIQSSIDEIKERKLLK